MSGKKQAPSLLLLSIVDIIQLSKGYVLKPIGIKMCVKLCDNLHCQSPVYDANFLSCKLLLSRTKGIEQVELKNKDLKRKPVSVPNCREPSEDPGSYRKNDSQLPSVCSEDYLNCKTNICQSSGLYENATGMCRQFRWHNPNAGQLHYLPCGPTDRFGVSVVGMLTIPRWADFRVDLDVIRGGDTLFHVKFTTQFLGFKNILVINTFFAGRWGREIVMSTMPLVGGQAFHLVVTLKNGHYRMMLDDVPLYNFTERLPRASPECIKVYHDVSVSLVEFTV